MIRAVTDSDLDWVLALNALLEIELSPLTRESLATLLGSAWHARAADEESGFLIALDQDADYDNENFSWFKKRFTRFVYVDRIAIAAACRGRGLARAFYEDLFREARAAGQSQVVCEVNREPPNLASDAFHGRLEFREVGCAELGNGKVVRYLSRTL